MMDGYGMGGGGWILMILAWAALLGLIGWAVVRIFPGRMPTTGVSGEQPLETLDRRLAHGEIDTDTYDQLRAKLTGDRGNR